MLTWLIENKNCLERVMTIKQLEVKLANAKTARERAEIKQAIAFLQSQSKKAKGNAYGNNYSDEN
jgi:hypothetical protein